jgi:hypothetical protein
MWCSNCQQDMPSIAHPTSGRMVCMRCQRTMRTRRPDHTVSISDQGIALDETAAATAAASPPRFDDWSATQTVRHLGRELRRSGIAFGAAQSGRRRFDPPQELFAQFTQRAAPSIAPVIAEPTAITRLHSRRAEGGQVAAWSIVLFGALLLVGGSGLIAWSLSAQQLHLWNLALGLTLGGQGTLIFGLVLVVSRLWRNTRRAAGKLQDVNARLNQLQHAADTLTAMRSGGAPAFYADLVRGASPHVLLANLKGQIDQLATRVGSSW